MKAQNISPKIERHENPPQKTLGRTTMEGPEIESSKKAVNRSTCPRITKTNFDPSAGHHLQRINTTVLIADKKDVEGRFLVEEADNNPRHSNSVGRVMVSFMYNDPGNPVNWSTVWFRSSNSVVVSDVV